MLGYIQWIADGEHWTGTRTGKAEEEVARFCIILGCMHAGGVATHARWWWDDGGSLGSRES